LSDVVEARRATDDLRNYFEPDRPPGTAPAYARSRFGSLAGGGDRPETSDRITADDVVAASLVSRGVPGDVAVELLEGDLGADISWHLEQIPVALAIDEPDAAEHRATFRHLSTAWFLLAEQPGMEGAVISALLARKRPRLVPVQDRVTRCAYGRPGDVGGWLAELFADADVRLSGRLVAVGEAAGLSEALPALLVLDAVVWMRHHRVHLDNGCPGLI